MSSRLRIGDDICAAWPEKARRLATIVGESRDKKCWWVIWQEFSNHGGVVKHGKTRYRLNKNFCREILEGWSDLE